jgi:hypothetical protein
MNDTRTLQEQRAVARAEKAAAEVEFYMKTVLERCSTIGELQRAIAAKDAACRKALTSLRNYDDTTAVQTIEAALSPDAGKGWLSPEEVKIALLHHRHGLFCVKHANDTSWNEGACPVCACEMFASGRDAWREDAMRLAISARRIGRKQTTLSLAYSQLYPSTQVDKSHLQRLHNGAFHKLTSQ